MPPYQPVVQQLRQLRRRGIRISIGTLLSIAFFPVAILAIAANFISERGLDLVTGTKPLAVPESNEPAESPTAPMAEVQVRQQQSSPKGEPTFISALDHFDSAVQDALKKGHAPTDPDFGQADRALQKERDQ